MEAAVSSEWALYKSSSALPPPLFKFDTSNLDSDRTEFEFGAPRKKNYVGSRLAAVSPIVGSFSASSSPAVEQKVEDEVDDVFGGRPIARVPMEVDKPDLTDGTTASSSASTEDERKRFIGSASSSETLGSLDDEEVIVDGTKKKAEDDEHLIVRDSDEKTQRTPRNGDVAVKKSVRGAALSTGLLNKKFRPRRTNPLLVPFNLYESSVVRDALGVRKEDIQHIVDQAAKEAEHYEKKAPLTPMKKPNVGKKARASWGGVLLGNDCSPGSDSSYSPGLPDSPTIETLRGGMAGQNGATNMLEEVEKVEQQKGMLRPKRRVFRRHSSGPFNVVGGDNGSGSGDSRHGSPIAKGHRLLFRGTLTPTGPGSPDLVVNVTPPAIQFTSLPMPHNMSPTGKPPRTPGLLHRLPLHVPESRQSYPVTKNEESIPNISRPPFKSRFSGSVLEAYKANRLAAQDKFETDFIVRRSLGRGEFSEAFEVVRRDSGVLCAIKKIDRILTGPRARLRLLEEAALLQEASLTSHPNILQFQDAWEQDNQLFIQTELCRCGTLDFFLEEYGQLYPHLDEIRVWKIATEVLAGLSHIHSLGIIHLDIKPGNLFVVESGGLKIGDFGVALKMSDNKFKSRRKTLGTSTFLSGDFDREGDRDYLAPEILGQRYGKEADLFSLGILLLEAATNLVLPQNGTSWQKLRRANLEEVEFHFLSPQLYAFLTQLLAFLPEDRTSADELLQHPIISTLSELRDASEVRGAICREPDGLMEELLELLPMERTGLHLQKWMENLENESNEVPPTDMDADMELD
ncbi:kinase-like protein [Atractiella rhizophila]|nr:kinase-like protein [Atractiella rhizophila]